MHRGDRPQPALLEVVERLLEFLTGVHDERAVVGHGLTDRLSAEEDDLEVRRVRVLLLVRADGQRGAVAEDGGLTQLDRTAVGTDGAAPGASVAWIIVIGVWVIPGPW